MHHRYSVTLDPTIMTQPDDLALVQASLDEHAAAIAALGPLTPTITAMAGLWWRALREGRSVLFCGNGGSAGDSQHMAAELTGRFEAERPGLSGLALTVDSSALTAIANDYGYPAVFARQIQALARPGDCVVCLSTSGNSASILAAATAARANGASVVGMTGASGGKLATACDVCLMAPSSRTARIQEVHILVGHCCCELIDHWHAGSTHVR